MARANDHSPYGVLKGIQDKQRSADRRLVPTARAVQYTPTSSADEAYAVGTIAVDATYTYVKHPAPTGWRRYSGSSF